MKQDIRDIIIKLLTEKLGLKRRRVFKVKEAQEKRQEVYNLSMKINGLESEIDALIIELGEK